jgi:hypothetical protein
VHAVGCDNDVAHSQASCSSHHCRYSSIHAEHFGSLPTPSKPFFVLLSLSLSPSSQSTRWPDSVLPPASPSIPPLSPPISMSMGGWRPPAGAGGPPPPIRCQRPPRGPLAACCWRLRRLRRVTWTAWLSLPPGCGSLCHGDGRLVPIRRFCESVELYPVDVTAGQGLVLDPYAFLRLGDPLKRCPWSPCWGISTRPTW